MEMAVCCVLSDDLHRRSKEKEAESIKLEILLLCCLGIRPRTSCFAIWTLSCVTDVIITLLSLKELLH